MQNVFDEFQFLKRFLIPALFPNILVFGFSLIGIDNDRHFLWRGLIGPYWHTEVFLFKALVVAILAFLGWKTVVLFAPVVVSAAETVQDARNRWECEKEELAYEKQHQSKLERNKKEAEEKHLRFLALPKAEQVQILLVENQRKEETKKLAEKQYNDFVRKQEAEKKFEEDEKVRAIAIANSPETKKKRALNDLTGGF